MKIEEPIDALAMSRRLRIQTGAKLRAMSRQKRLRYLHDRYKQVQTRLRKHGVRRAVAA